LLVVGASAVAELGSWRERLRGAMFDSRGPGFPFVVVREPAALSRRSGQLATAVPCWSMRPPAPSNLNASV
jgi:hypothetical protein